MAVERLAASDFVIALLFVMRVWPRTKPSLVRNGSHGLSDSPIPVASSRLYPGLHDQGVLRPSTVLLSLKGIAMLNEVHHLFDLFRACEPGRWLFGEPIPKWRESIRYGCAGSFNSFPLCAVPMLRGCSCRGIVIGSYHPPTRGGFRQTGRWRDWGRYRDRKTRTTLPGYGN